jgi:beta-glucanase (GH16 family)
MMKIIGGVERTVARPPVGRRVAAAAVAVLATTTLAVGGTAPGSSAAPAAAHPAGAVSLAVLRSTRAERRGAARARRCAVSARPKRRKRCPVLPGSMPAPAGYATKLFDDTFAGTRLDRTKWNTYITSRAANGWPWNANGFGGSGMNGGGLNAEYFSPSQVAVDNGLSLSAVRRSVRAGTTWTSGVLTTYGKFEFDGGYVQIKAKMPAGAGMWPGLWMLPGPGAGNGDNFEVDMFEGNYLMRGASPNDVDAWHLHTPSGMAGGLADTGVDLAAGYHVYGLRWVPGKSITWYVDNKVVGSLTSAQSAIPNEPMELILDLQVADNAASGWITTAGASTPSPSTLQVAEVQVYR